MRYIRAILIGTLLLSGGTVVAAVPAMAATAIEYGAVPATKYHPGPVVTPATKY